MKKGTKEFLGGALLGAVLGAAGSVLLASEAGKKVRGDIKQRVADFYAYAAPKLKKLKNIGEKEYAVFVKNAVGQYGKLKKLSKAEEAVLVKEAVKTWKHLKKHL